MLCFIGCQNTEKTELIMTYEDKQFYLTLDKGNDLEKYFYEKIKEDGSINLSASIYSSSKQFGITLTESINKNTFDISGNIKTYKAGDIFIYFTNICYLYISYGQGKYTNSQKVGELENSSLDAFISFSNGLTGGQINFIFTLKPEQSESESILKKMITVIVVVISLTLFYIIYLLIQF